MSSTGRRSLLLVPLVALLAGNGITGAVASPPAQASASASASASGTFTYLSSTFRHVRSDHGDKIIRLTATVSYTGTFRGRSTVLGKLILHANGTANFYDVETFAGTVKGVRGTVTFFLSGWTDRAGVVRATDVIVSATGKLDDLDGLLREVGTVPSPDGPAGTYTGAIRFSQH